MRRHLRTSIFVLPIVLIAMLTEITTGAEESADTWTANPAVVEATAKRSPAANYFEEKLPPYTLPDPLVSGDGTRVTKETWPARRAEILELFRQHVYGRAQSVNRKVCRSKHLKRTPATWTAAPRAGSWKFHSTRPTPADTRSPCRSTYRMQRPSRCPRWCSCSFKV